VSSVFHRAPDLPVALSAEGCWITDTEGRRYLDACGGAIVNNVGHGRREVIDAIAAQMARVDYVHAHSFTTEAVERYAARLAPLVPVSDARVFPVSGGSEAIETALKLARAYHLANGEPERDVVISRRGSYHGNTLGALDASGRESLRRGYEPWLGRFSQTDPVNEYRCTNPEHPADCGAWHVRHLEEAIESVGSGRVAAFIAEPIGGATLGATVPPAGYWRGVAEVCRRYGILLIADEVMTGFGRTGRWFGLEHFEVAADVLVSAKGASSGYWPLGLCVASGSVVEIAAPMFGHGYTYSHHPGGAAAGHAVLDIIESEDLVSRAAASGAHLLAGLGERLGSSPFVGDIRGAGLLVAVEFVAERESRTPFPRVERVAERVRAELIRRGVIGYLVTGCADGIDGDALAFGPPLTITLAELDLVSDALAEAIGSVLGFSSN